LRRLRKLVCGASHPLPQGARGSAIAARVLLFAKAVLRVTRVSVETMKIVEAMRAEK
jgi:hypothetical protein